MPRGLVLERRADEMCKKKGWFNCNQFHNPLNIKAHYRFTGPEIFNQYKEMYGENSQPSAFIAGTGTGGERDTGISL